MFLFLGIALGIAVREIPVNQVLVVVIVLAIPVVLLSILLIIGGIYALRRKIWGLVLAGSIAEYFLFPPVGVAAIALTILAKDEFTVKSKLSTTGESQIDRKSFVISLVAGLIPIVVLTTIAMTQLGRYAYTNLGEIIILIQAGYVLLLIPIMIVFFSLRKKEIALGVLLSFALGLPVAIATIGMGM